MRVRLTAAALGRSRLVFYLLPRQLLVLGSIAAETEHGSDVAVPGYRDRLCRQLVCRHIACKSNGLLNDRVFCKRGLH